MMIDDIDAPLPEFLIAVRRADRPEPIATRLVRDRDGLDLDKILLLVQAANFDGSLLARW